MGGGSMLEVCASQEDMGLTAALSAENVLDSMGDTYFI